MGAARFYFGGDFNFELEMPKKEEEFFGSCGPFCWVRSKADLVSDGEQLIRLDIMEEFG